MSAQEDTIRFSVSIPRKLFRELDRRVIRRGYPSRSEFVRDLIRERIVADRWAEGAREVVGVLTIGYDHHQRQLVQRLIDIQHNRHVNVLCTTHVHMDHDHCLEAIVLKGRPSEIERLCNEISGLRGVKTAGLTRASRVDA
jgi:CopG family nickel-responsive transcriptional regulator